VRIIVCGSRNYDGLVCDPILDALGRDGWPVTIVHGGATGADAAAGRWVRSVGNEEEVHYPDWDNHGKAAGPMRNQKMAELGADLCIAFWDGKSLGTRSMIEQAVRHNIQVRIVPWSKK
jgi:hypothetical protein